MARTRPDPQSVLQQILVCYHVTGPRHAMRRYWLGLGGYAQLRAAGLGASRARAVNLMTKRVAAQWRKDNHQPGPAELDAEVQRLLT